MPGLLMALAQAPVLVDREEEGGCKVFECVRGIAHGPVASMRAAEGL